MAAKNDCLVTACSILSPCSEPVVNDADTVSLAEEQKQTCEHHPRNPGQEKVVNCPNTSNGDQLSQISQSCEHNVDSCHRETKQNELSSNDLHVVAKTEIFTTEDLPLSGGSASEHDDDEIQIADDDVEAGSLKTSEELDMLTDVKIESHESADMTGDELGDNEQELIDQSNENCAEDVDPMMGFEFNEEGRLCDKDGQPFKFNYFNEKSKNQQRYERIGEAITEKIYELLKTECGLKKLMLPLGVHDDEPHSFIFVSNDALETTDRLLLLIHGSGVVRAGQWARRLIINDDLEKGTQIPYIKRALSDGYQVIVFNTNRNRWPDGGKNAKPIPGNDDPESHASYVWNNVVVRQSKAQHIAVVAHSYGGVVTTHLLEQEMEEFTKRVFAVAFTDSVHTLGFNPVSGVTEFYQKFARNYVASDLPLAQPIQSRCEFVANGAERVSAGHLKHEWTSYSSMESVFKYLQDKYEERLSSRSSN